MELRPVTAPFQPSSFSGWSRDRSWRSTATAEGGRRTKSLAQIDGHKSSTASLGGFLPVRRDPSFFAIPRPLPEPGRGQPRLGTSTTPYTVLRLISEFCGDTATTQGLRQLSTLSLVCRRWRVAAFPLYRSVSLFPLLGDLPPLPQFQSMWRRLGLFLGRTTRGQFVQEFRVVGRGDLQGHYFRDEFMPSDAKCTDTEEYSSGEEKPQSPSRVQPEPLIPLLAQFPYLTVLDLRGAPALPPALPTEPLLAAIVLNCPLLEAIKLARSQLSLSYYSGRSGADSPRGMDDCVPMSPPAQKAGAGEGRSVDAKAAAAAALANAAALNSTASLGWAPLLCRLEHLKVVVIGSRGLSYPPYAALDARSESLQTLMRRLRVLRLHCPLAPGALDALLQAPAPLLQSLVVNALLARPIPNIGITAADTASSGGQFALLRSLKVAQCVYISALLRILEITAGSPQLQRVRLGGCLKGSPTRLLQSLVGTLLIVAPDPNAAQQTAKGAAKGAANNKKSTPAAPMVAERRTSRPTPPSPGAKDGSRGLPTAVTTGEGSDDQLLQLNLPSGYQLTQLGAEFLVAPNTVFTLTGTLPPVTKRSLAQRKNRAPEEPVVLRPIFPFGFGFHADMFTRLTTNLTAIELVDVGLTDAPARWPFLGPQLQALSLKRNHLTDVTALLGAVAEITTDLRSLDLSENDLKSLPEEIGRCTSLHLLRIGGNQLVKLPVAVAHLSQLRELAIEQNKLQSFPAPLLFMTALQELDLTGNPSLQPIPENFFSRCTRLQILRLAGSQLQALPSTISQVPMLRILDLSNNPIAVLPRELAELHALERLDLRGTPQPELWWGSSSYEKQLKKLKAALSQA